MAVNQQLLVLYLLGYVCNNTQVFPDVYMYIDNIVMSYLSFRYYPEYTTVLIFYCLLMFSTTYMLYFYEISCTYVESSRIFAIVNFEVCLDMVPCTEAFMYTCKGLGIVNEHTYEDGRKMMNISYFAKFL